MSFVRFVEEKEPSVSSTATAPDPPVSVAKEVMNSSMLLSVVTFVYAFASVLYIGSWTFKKEFMNDLLKSFRRTARAESSRREILADCRQSRKKPQCRACRW